MTPNTGIDTAINNAASRMTSAKPTDALRANVMSRISSGRTAGLRAGRFHLRQGFGGRVGAGFAAMASIALVAFLAWPHNAAISQSANSTPTVINPTLINLTASVHPTGADAPTSPLTSIVRTVADESARLIFTADADQAGMSVPALEHPEPITFKPLFDGVPVKAIDIEPLRVAPLVVPAIGDDNQ